MAEDIEKQLLEMRYLTAKTGMLTTLQTKNLQMWGYLTISDALPKLKVYFDFDERRVVYVVEQLMIHAPELDKLALWVREMLGPEYMTVVEYKNGPVYRSKRQAELPNKTGNEYVVGQFEEPKDE